MDRLPESAVKRLPRSFHQTFIPERRFINALLRLAASGGGGTVREIADATGIPTGDSSGKVAPTIDYSRGMGLLEVSESGSVKRLSLTPFGRIVYLEDPHLRTGITQWLAHFRLCSEASGAEVWYQTFWQGTTRLGPQFLRDDLERWLATACGANPGSLIGPLVSMYNEDASFLKCHALAEDAKVLKRIVAPTEPEYAWGYAAWFLSGIQNIGREGEQVTLPELDAACGVRALTGWSIEDQARVLQTMEQKGAFTVDRQMRPWVVQARIGVADVWRRLYSDLL